MHPLERRILAALRTHGLAPQGSRGLVCVSGGPDSVALLCLLHAVRAAQGLRLDVAHFDHGLRPESAAEADWVARCAGALELPCHIVRATHLAPLADRGSSIQAAARTWRRAEARRLAAQWDAAWIATGHQRDDHLETLLLKWLRGAHLAHLRGMAWRDGPFVRPLLGTRRAELEAYLRGRGQDWLEDPTNRTPRYKRNRVRHELLPLLDGLAPGGIARRLDALEAQSAQYEALLDALLADRTPARSAPDAAPHWIDAEALAALAATAPALAAHALHSFVVERLPGALTAGHLERALALLGGGRPAWSLHLPRRRRLRRRGGRLLLDALPDAPESGGSAPAPPASEVVHTVGSGEQAVRVRAPAGWRVREAAADEPALALHNLPPGAALQVRPRSPGDRFHPPWRERPLKLARFLRDQGLPLWQREGLPVVLLDGRIVAVAPRFVARGFNRPAAGSAAPPLRLWVAPA